MTFLKKITIVTATAALMAAFLIVRGVTAANAAGGQAVGCVITQDDIAAIKAIQNNPTLDYQSEVIQELSMRKSLLATTIACAKAEIGTLRDTLEAVLPADTGASAIQDQLAGKLDDASNYYDLETSKLPGAGISGTEQVAKEVLSWRASVLPPLDNQIDSFAVWSENQPLFTAATARMTQVGRIVSFLSATDDNDLASAFGKAQASFHAAQDENAATKRALAQSLSGDQISVFMQQSLQSLSSTYQNFFSISTILQGVTSDAGQK